MQVAHDARSVSAVRRVEFAVDDRSAPVTRRNETLANLRTFVTLLVVAHHAALAYHQYAPPLPASLTAATAWPAFPIVDSQRWGLGALLVGINDTFFMSLMFLVSGIFAWPSLVRKGAGPYLRDRTVRLGLPFIVSAALLAPLAYYPTYLMTTAPGGVAGYVRTWIGLGQWYAGPAWFLWVLLAFGGVLAVLFARAPRFVTQAGQLFGRLADRPLRWVALLVVLSTVAYLPMAGIFGAENWLHAGPFWIQAGRTLHYLVYFLVGAALGAYGNDRGLLAHDGRLARRWPLWLAMAIGAFVFGTVMLLTIIGTLAHGGPGVALSAMGNFSFVLCCAGWSVLTMALFLRFGTRSNGAARSLGANAYGIYLFHYVFVTWLQYSLLGAGLPGAVKFAIVFTGAVAGSWALSALARRVPAVAKVIG